MGKRTKPPRPKELSRNFAEKVNRLEDIVRRREDPGALQELLEMYTVAFIQEAICHYEGLEDQRFLDYHEKMKQLLRKTQAAKQVYLESYAEQKQKSVEEDVLGLLKDNHCSACNSTVVIRADIAIQADRLQARISYRCQRSVDRGSPRTACSESDHFMSSVVDMEGYLQELEQHTERYIERKLAALERIETKYKLELACNSDSSLAELEACKAAEVEAAKAEIEQKHRESVNQLKSRYIEAY